MNSAKENTPQPVRRVLFAEREPLLRWSVVETLRQGPYLVTAVGDARDAAMAAGQIDYDVILVAEELPDFDGLTLLRALRRISPGAQLVMVATHATRALVDAAMADGAFDVLEKPISMTDIENTIVRALGSTQQAA